MGKVAWSKHLHDCGIGIGAIVAGLGGLAALFQTGNILSRVTQLDQKVANAEAQIKAADDHFAVIEGIIRELKEKYAHNAANAVSKSPEFQGANPTPENISNAIQSTPEIKVLPNNQSWSLYGHVITNEKKEPIIYLNESELTPLSIELAKIKDPIERKKTLENALRIEMSINKNISSKRE